MGTLDRILLSDPVISVNIGPILILNIRSVHSYPGTRFLGREQRTVHRVGTGSEPATALDEKG